VEGSLFDVQVESDFEGRNARAARAWFSTYVKRTQAVLKARCSKDDERVRIAVLDTGIDLDHPIIAKCKTSIVECRSWVVDDTSISDVCGHGTHIASVLLKLAPWADLYVARVFKDASEVGNAGVDAVVKAINHARTEWKVDIISLSFGYRLRKPAIETAIDACASTKPPILIFAAAANTGAREDRPAFPARMGSVFCINSASGDGTAMSYNPPMLRGRFNFTFLGDAITGAWPVARSADDGVIISNSGKGPERILSGTSLAAPVAVSVAAAVLELCRQRPRIPEFSDLCVARVQSYDGMHEVFRATMQDPEVREYMLIQPWRLFDAREAEEAEDARLAAGRRLASAIQKEFGT
jgi:subtilisin family serine protease